LGDFVSPATYQAAQDLFAREQLSDGQIHVLQNIGIAYALDLQDMPRALDAFAQALKLAEATSNRRETVLAHLFRGEALYRMDRVDDAGRDFDLALAGARQIGAVEEQWTAQYGLGRVSRHKGHDARAAGLRKPSPESNCPTAGHRLAQNRVWPSATSTTPHRYPSTNRAQPRAALRPVRRPTATFRTLRARMQLPAFESSAVADAFSLIEYGWHWPRRCLGSGRSGHSTPTTGDTTPFGNSPQHCPLLATGVANAGRTDRSTPARRHPHGPSRPHWIIPVVSCTAPFECPPDERFALVVEQYAVSHLALPRWLRH
jgi:hypothetical protein